MSQLSRVSLLGTPVVHTEQGEAVSFVPDLRYRCLAYLARTDAWVGRDDLLYLFWPDTPQDKAREKLRHLLYRIRKLGWTHSLEADAHRVRWRVETDTTLFETAIKAREWGRAVDLYSGPFLKGLDGGPLEFAAWLDLERAELAHTYQRAALARSDELTGAGNHAEAADLLGGLHRAEPTDERLFQRYLASLMEADDTQGAEVAFEAFQRTLHAEFGTEPEPLTRELLEREVGVRRSATAVAVSNPTPLPERGTTFIGRDPEMAELDTLLQKETCRLITIVGQGGTGKTRLALEQAKRQQEQSTFRNGVRVIGLESIDNPDDIAIKIAEGLSLPLQGKEPPALQVQRFLKDEQCLLVLDNYEHLLSGATLLSDMLKTCLKLKLLITSRERLRLEEEWLFTLPGLSYPSEPVTLDVARAHDAVQLFRERACRVQRHFTLSDETVDKVTNICRLVDGMPLALELAATWLRITPLADIGRELSSLTEVATNIHPLPERHQSLRALFEHSWKLLPQKAQATLARLTVFRGGFTRDAAHRVVGANLSALLTLVDKSLLEVSPQGRYAFHPLLFQFLQQKLKAEDLAELQEQHADYFLHFLLDNVQRLNGSDEKVVHDLFAEEQANVRAAWLWAVNKLELEWLRQASDILAIFVEKKKRWWFGRELFASAIAHLDEANPKHRPLLGKLLTHQAWFVAWLALLEETRTIVQRSLALLRQQGDSKELLKGLYILSFLSYTQCRFEEGKDASEEGLAVARRMNNPIMVSTFLAALAMSELFSGQLREAKEHALEACHLAGQKSTDEALPYALKVLAYVNMFEGDYHGAKQNLEKAVEIAKRKGVLLHLNAILLDLSFVALETHDYETALKLIEEVLNQTDAPGDKNAALFNLGLMKAKQGDYNAAYSHYQDALREAHKDRITLLTLTLLMRVAELDLSTGRYRRAAELANFLVRYELTPHPFRHLTGQMLGALPNLLNEKEKALTSSTNLTLEEAILRALAT